MLSGRPAASRPGSGTKNIADKAGSSPFRDGFEFDLGSDANGDIYYRDAGILERLAKGTDGEVLELDSGLPAWKSSGKDSIRDVARNLIVITNLASPNSRVDIDADEVMLQDSSGISRAFSAINLTVDITANGDSNGLDTLPGVGEAVDTWYYLFVIAKEDGTVQGLLSTSSTAPTMPSGYTFKALVGAVRNDSGSNFIPFEQIDNVVTYNGVQTIKDGSFSPAVTWTSQSVAAFFPVTAKRINCIGGTTDNQDGQIGISPRSDGEAGDYFREGSTSGGISDFGIMPTARRSWSKLQVRYESTIYWYVVNANSTLVASGWEY